MLSVVMPIYNEGRHIFDNIGRTIRVMGEAGEIEIIPVDDGSLDDSAAELGRAAEAWPQVRPVLLGHAGKGEALRRGALESRGEWVIFLDADLELPPEQITLFLALQRTHGADAVIGSKMHPDSTVVYPMVRRLYSWGYYCLTKLLFGLPVRDTQTGLKLVRRELLVRALEQTELKGFAFDLELLVRLVQLGARMVEAPVVVNHRMEFSSIGMNSVLDIAIETFHVWSSIRRTARPQRASSPPP